jgi:cysteine-rich repeat protein
VQYGEQCDFGTITNGTAGSNCAATCQIITPAQCGDGKVDASEECDDGNLRDFDGCSAQCRVETGECGDGVLQRGFGEQCDLGARNGLTGALCDATCHRLTPPRCGDGAVNDSNEQCDLGSQNRNTQGSLCLKNCLLPSCGDGIRGNGEQCDDGNLFAFDGCDATCQVEITVLAPQPEPEPAPAPIASIIPTRPVVVREVPKKIPTPAKTPTGPGLFIVMILTGAFAGAQVFRRRFL